MATLPTAAAAITLSAIAVAAVHGAAPDLIVGEIAAATKWGSADGVTAYSFAFTYCNVGDGYASVFAEQPEHPAIITNLYRVMDGRLEQVGLGFAFHEYCVLQALVCGACVPEQIACTRLGVNCSTHTGSTNAGQQHRLGPRREIDPSSGEVLMPFTGINVTGDAIFKRLQARNDDLDPALNPGAVYFVDMQIVAQDDASGGNGLNNASWRRVAVGAFSSGGYGLAPSGSTVRERNAIEAWASLDPGVRVSIVNAGPGRMLVLGSRVSPHEGGWAYEYALLNATDPAAVGSFAVPLKGGPATQIGFHDVNYHSGEPFDPTDWSAIVTSDTVEWSSPSTWDDDPNSNALRWGTTYNFRFVSPQPPVEGEVELLPFAPGGPSPVLVAATWVPRPPPPPCVGDANSDGLVNFGDATAVLSAWGTIGEPWTFGDADGDGSVGFLDITVVLANWGQPCD